MCFRLNADLDRISALVEGEGARACHAILRYGVFVLTVEAAEGCRARATRCERLTRRKGLVDQTVDRVVGGLFRHIEAEKSSVVDVFADRHITRLCRVCVAVREVPVDDLFHRGVREPAGNKAPAYFHLMWDAMNGEGLTGLASTYLVKLAAAHRNAGNIVSSAEVIEAARLAAALSQLRGSKYPCLQDLKDAAVTTMGHGNYSELAVAFADTEIGKTIGYLPEGVARTSVQEDFYRQLKKLKLERFRTAELQHLDLDLREKLTVKSQDAAFLDLNRSFFLHRLRVLGIRFANALRSKQDQANWGNTGSCAGLRKWRSKWWNLPCWVIPLRGLPPLP